MYGSTSVFFLKNSYFVFGGPKSAKNQESGFFCVGAEKLKENHAPIEKSAYTARGRMTPQNPEQACGKSTDVQWIRSY